MARPIGYHPDLEGQSEGLSGAAKTAIYVGLALLIALIVGVFSGCAWDKPNASAYVPRPGYPCGVLGVTCLDPQGAVDGFCCNEGETCGGGKYEVGCGTYAEHLCCDIQETQTSWGKRAGRDAGDPLFGADVVIKVVGPQRSATAPER